MLCRATRVQCNNNSSLNQIMVLILKGFCPDDIKDNLKHFLSKCRLAEVSHMVLVLSLATLPGMWDRTVTIGSAGKTFSVTGWKVRHLWPQLLILNSQYFCTSRS